MKLDKCLTPENMNQRVLAIQYAVRGPIVQRAALIERELQKGVPKSFERVVYANIADAHALGQKPITFIRQVLSAVTNPILLESSHLPNDVKKRAQELLNDCKQQSVGAYSPFNGLNLVRQHIAEFITRRDGVPSSSNDIYLGSGASDIVKSVLNLFAEEVDGKPSSIMIPCPQYPLFSAALSELGLQPAYYLLDEEDHWAIRVQELRRSYEEASAHSNVRAIAIINPGNPTGQILSRQNIEEIIKFAYEHNVFILADEVHQNNAITKSFLSVKKVMHEMGPPYSEMELASFFTASKGWAAESGLRSGYGELVRVHPRVREAFHTMCGVMQCPSVLGQCVLDCVVKPPLPGDESYEQFTREVTSIRRIFAERTAAAVQTFNSIPGYSCNVIDGVKKPFDRVVFANIADAHALGQKPITFLRQVLSAVSNPALLKSLDLPKDVKERAGELLDSCKQRSVGAYSASAGLPIVRRHIAEFITRRDGVPSSPDDIFIGSGASDVIKSLLTLFVKEIDGKPPAIMLSCPQYPLFSGTLSELGLKAAYYQLDEKKHWSVSVQELNRCYEEASIHSNVRAILITNPGNPTGQVLSRLNIEEIIKFAFGRNLFLIIDEVYQDNVTGKPFLSFKKVMHEMGPPYSEMELASFFAASKGWAAESGLRSGYGELVRMQPQVLSAFLTMRGVLQCPSVLGQCALDCVVKPPVPGEESYEQFTREVGVIHRLLAERSVAAAAVFNSIPGYFCNTINGGIVAFPRVEIPERARALAAELHISPDEFYVMRLLEEKGVCVVPGTGFGQLPGTFHFRVTILHPPEQFQHMLQSIRDFHIEFMEIYS